jgi:hypothetical protein
LDIQTCRIKPAAPCANAWQGKKMAIRIATAESPRVMMPFPDAGHCEALKHQERF